MDKRADHTSLEARPDQAMGSEHRGEKTGYRKALQDKANAKRRQRDKPLLQAGPMVRCLTGNEFTDATDGEYADWDAGSS